MKPTLYTLSLCSLLLSSVAWAKEKAGDSTAPAPTAHAAAEELLKLVLATPAKQPDVSSKAWAKEDACCAAKTDAKAAIKAEEKGCCAHDGQTAGPSDVSRKSEIVNYSPASLYQIDATFTTDTGQPFALGSLQGRPVVLAMFFASCGYACPLIIGDMQAIRTKLPADLRDRAALVLVSFDAKRDTPAALATFRKQRELGDQWILLHGDNDSVRELAALLGVKYRQEADGAFAHSNLISILNPAGEIVHQRQGLRGGLDEAALALAQTR